MVRARFRVEGGRCLSSVSAGRPCDRLRTLAGRDGGIGHGKAHSRTGLVRVGGGVRLFVEWLRHRRCHQAGSGIARSRARARLNWVSQGQRCVRCRVRRRAERVSRPARPKKRRLRVLVVTICSPRPIRTVQRARLWAITWTASQAALARPSRSRDISTSPVPATTASSG